jgi:hypothetical protein
VDDRRAVSGFVGATVTYPAPGPTAAFGYPLVPRPEREVSFRNAADQKVRSADLTSDADATTDTQAVSVPVAVGCAQASVVGPGVNGTWYIAGHPDAT